MSCMALSRVEAFSELGKDILEKDRKRGREGETVRADHVSTKSGLSSMEEKSAANQYRSHTQTHALFSDSARQSEIDRHIEA